MAERRVCQLLQTAKLTRIWAEAAHRPNVAKNRYKANMLGVRVRGKTPIDDPRNRLGLK